MAARSRPHARGRARRAGTNAGRSRATTTTERAGLQTTSVACPFRPRAPRVVVVADCRHGHDRTGRCRHRRVVAGTPDGRSDRRFSSTGRYHFHPIRSFVDLQTRPHHPEQHVPKAHPTTRVGYRNRNRQRVERRTELPGNDHLQRVYVLSCGRCSSRSTVPTGPTSFSESAQSAKAGNRACDSNDSPAL